jgi:hypothetical protein
MKTLNFMVTIFKTLNLNIFNHMTNFIKPGMNVREFGTIPFNLQILWLCVPYY